MFRSLLTLGLLVSVSMLGLADGTLATSDLLNSLRASNPELIKTLETGFDLDKDAEGLTIGRAINAKLAGARIGPYTINGTIRGNTEPVHLTITLNTKHMFTDAHGGVQTSKVTAAATVTEKLESVTITTKTP